MGGRVVRPPRRRGGPRLPWPSLAAAALVLAYVAAFVLGMRYTTYDSWGALLIAPVLVLATLPLLARATARESDPRITHWLVVALCCKLLAAYPRYLMAFVLYGGQADAAMYDERGRALAAVFSQGVWDPDLGDQRVMGTGFVVILTGLVYTVIGPSLLGGFLVYSWLGFIGLLLFWKAFRTAFPAGEHRRYLLLVFFLPSLLFWPSSIGKDSWMMFGLGVTAYGTARLLERRRGAFLLLGLGSLATAVVRPHVTVLAVAALVVAYVLRRRPQQVSALGPVRALASLAVLGLLCMLALTQVSAYFGTGVPDPQAVSEVLAETQRRTAQGGSAEADAVEDGAPGAVSLSPADIPAALVTVLFRPFPWEAHNGQALLASGESALLLVAFCVAWRRLARLPLVVLRQPYVAFVLVYTVLFCWAFSNINNLGILSRERVMVYPLALALLAVPVPARGRARGRPPGGPGAPTVSGTGPGAGVTGLAGAAGAAGVGRVPGVAGVAGTAEGSVRSPYGGPIR
ncbi:hypothetical protein [Allostreptomyces psammosilenae]|uniref:Glycosyltransferase RgtA/B/C/D-like domain-containing protein n=1 Tax=Allostreptomyces psammosilenae TaxID=1892865 RepID=A0A852ZYJ4_9ACTN|nr:hypothetical protein [Allostreptomyces psammosilenae]NYI07453.1 hypothetical protein [Allostreptomyces psammosilenae]